MTPWKKRISSAAVGTFVAGCLIFAGASSAQAAGPNHSVGPFTTKSACETAKRSYISSWTKISQGCTYYPRQGGFTATGYYFHYRSVV